MFLYTIICIVVLSLFCENDCRQLHHRSYPMRRQNSQILQQNPNPAMHGFYPTLPVYPQNPPLDQNPINPGNPSPPLPPPPPVMPSWPLPPPNSIKPSEIASFPYSENPVMPSGMPFLPNLSYPLVSNTVLGNSTSSSNYKPTTVSSSRASFLPILGNENPNMNYPSYVAKFKRKNVPENAYEIGRLLENRNKMHSNFNPWRTKAKRRRKNVPEIKNYMRNKKHLPSNLRFLDAGAKRRRKNAPEKESEMRKILEEGKKILQMSTVSSIFGKENNLKSLNGSLEDNDEGDSNITLIPIPKGIQIKTNSSDGEKHVEKTVNITSSTQKTLSIDNNTEIENVVEMQMKKKIEDNKGDSRGYEEVRIVQTELVKPIVKKEWNVSTHKHRKRRFHVRKFGKHHRSKRSETSSEDLSSPTFYNKLARKFLSNLKRKERMAEKGHFLNQQEISTLSDIEIKSTTKTTKSEKEGSLRDKSMYDSNEMEDFLKHFLSQLIKLKKINEKNKLKSRHIEFSRLNQKYKGNKQSKYKKEIKQNFPEHMKMVMNFNMTWDGKAQEKPIRSQTKQEKIKNLGVDTGTTAIRSESSTQETYKILYVNDKKETLSGLLILGLILSVIALLLPILMCILPQLYKTVRLNHRCSEGCRICHEQEYNKAKTLCNFHRERLCAKDYLQLEWQSDTGDWLSEKEIDFK